MIQVTGLSKSFGNTRVLDQISFHIDAGERVLLLGANGAGKTTLLRVIAGLVSPTAGKTVLSNGSLTCGYQERTSLIGYVGHQCMLYEELTPQENLRFYGTLYGIQDNESAVRAEALIQMIEMSEYRNVPVKQLSQGQRKRVSIARALMHDPPILLFDEPFSALDASARAWLSEIISGTSGKTVLLATHQPEQDFPSAQRALILMNGTLVEDQPIGGHVGYDVFYSTVMRMKR